MGTIAQDPLYGDGSLPAPARSDLPPGGDPRCDLAYETWLKSFVAIANLHWCDRFWHALPEREILKTYQLTGHLYKWLIGCEFPPGHGPNYLHRLRFVAIQFRLRPQEIRREAERYLAGLVESALSDDPR